MGELKELRERLLAELEYNPHTGQLKRRCNTGGARKGQIAGWTENTGYVRLYFNGKTWQAHKLIWLMVHGRFTPEQIDHINHDRSDNRLSNLRAATKRQNGRNQKLRVDSTSGVPGVYPRPNGKWQAMMQGDHKEHLGTFNTFEEAVAARKKAERKYGYHENHGASL